MFREYYRMSNNTKKISKHIHRISRDPEYHRILEERHRIFQEKMGWNIYRTPDEAYQLS
jgi:N-acyl-L-homoserine lactone synthetase